MMRRTITTSFSIVVCLGLASVALSAERKDQYGDPLPDGAVQRLGTNRMRYSISDMAYSLDGQRALVICGRELHVWDLVRGERIRCDKVSDGSLRTLALSRDGRAALMGDGAATVIEWDLQEHKVKHTFATGAKSLASVCYSPDEKRVLTLDSSISTVEEWDKATGKKLISVTAPEPRLEHCVYGPDGATVLAGRGPAGNQVYQYDLKTGALLKKFDSNYCVYDMELSGDSKRLLVGTRSRAAEWQFADYKCLKTFTGHHGGAVPSVAYARDDRLLLTGSRDGSIRLWDRIEGKVLKRWFPHQRYVLKIRVSPDGKWALTYGGDRLIIETSMETGKPRLQWDRHMASVQAVAFSPDGSMVVSGSMDGTIRLWNAATWKSVRTIENPGTEVHCLAISPDGKRIAAGSKDGTVREFLLATGEPVRTMSGHLGYVHEVVYTGDGRNVISAADDGTLRLWDIEKGQPIHIMSGHIGGVLAAALSPDGKRVLSGGRDGTVREWDLATGKLLRTTLAHRGWVESVAYSPNGTRAVSAGRSGLVIEWDLPDWRARRTLDYGAWVEDTRYVLNGKCICAAGHSGKIVLWNAESGEMAKTFTHAGGSVHTVAPSPDGRWLLTGAEDATVLVWEAPAAAPEQK